MKLKTTAIAMAVAGTVAAPVAVQAGADEVYASARVGIQYRDIGDTADFDVRSFASRFGMRGETDLGNGLTGFGRYEVSMDFNDGASIGNRHRYVGLKGDWGSLTLGQTYHTFYNFVVGPLDNPWWHSGVFMVNYRGRTDKAITYAGGAGAMSFGVTGYFDHDAEEEAPDAYELGFGIGIGDSTVAFAYQGTETVQGPMGTDDEIIGVAWHGIGLGDTTLGVSWMNQEDVDGLVVDWLIGNAYVHVEQAFIDLPSGFDDVDPLSITLGYTQSLGRKTTMYYEFNNSDLDISGIDDVMTVMAVLKYDII